MTTCPTCGSAVGDGDRFCRECGTPLPWPEPDANDVTGVIDLGDSGPIPVVPPAEISGLGPGAAVLVVRRGPNEGTRFVLEGEELLAGRAPDSAIFLDDVTVSRRHATFSSSDGSWTVTDAGSLNGTYVNKERIEGPTVLVSGDEVQVGKYRFTFASSAGEPA